MATTASGLRRSCATTASRRSRSRVASSARLRGVERLDDEIARAQRERPVAHLRGDVGGEHEHRSVFTGHGQASQVGQHLEAVPMRHVQVEEDQVRAELIHERQDLTRIGRAHELAVPGRGEQRLEQVEVRLLVVDEQDPAPGQSLRAIAHPVPSGRKRSTTSRNSSTSSGLVR
jgi:hypothetical protein